VSLREKDLPRGERAALLARLRQRAPSDLALMIHGDVDLAAELGLAGVHLPAGGDVAAARRRLGPCRLIGLSTHGAAEAEAAHGADYVTLSPIFTSASKPGYGPALGLAALAQACRSAPCPVLALGGMSPDVAGAVSATGAGGIAVMGEIMRAAEPGETVRRCLDALRS
jgi:thiamine-phosphate pyrophosphorylase